MNQLARQLTLIDAIVIGLAAMIGSGVFLAFSPAAALAQSAVFFSLLLAALVAFLNAMTMSSLAAIYPQSGGTYVYARNILGPYLGYLAGASFVIGKLASCSAMAFAIGAYLTPSSPKLTAMICVLSVVLINIIGIKKTALASKIILVIVVSILIGATSLLFLESTYQFPALIPASDAFNFYGLLQGASVLFFAFAGYARVATLGEEVINPTKNIPLAIAISLSLTVLLYFFVAAGLFGTLDITTIALSNAPLSQAIQQTHNSFMINAVIMGAIIASYGVLLSLSAGVSRTVYAMAQNNDLPVLLSKVGKFKTPYLAEMMVGLIIILIISQSNLLKSISFSSFAILLYYSIAHLCVIKMDKQKSSIKIRAAAALIITLSLSFILPLSTTLLGSVILTGLSLIYLIKKSKLWT